MVYRSFSGFDIAWYKIEKQIFPEGFYHKKACHCQGKKCEKNISDPSFIKAFKHSETLRGGCF